MSSSSPEPGPPAAEPASNGRLDSWKEIASYLRRSVRSAKRWEKEEELPVHRHHHEKRDSVYAYRAELDTWWTSRGAKLTDQNGAEEAGLPPEHETLDGEPGVEDPEPEEEVAPPSLRAPRRAALIGGGFALAIVLVGGAAWLARNGSGPSAASLRPLPFKARDWVLVTSFENRTNQPLFDGTLEYALQRELSNSRYVNVVPRERIGDALRLMRKPLDTRVDAAAGREICLRDGDIRALITGRIERLGSKYLLSVELVDPNQGASTASVTEEVARDEQLLPATQRVSDRVRAMLGENPPLTRQGEGNLLKVTTPSLRALQLYSQADALIASNNSAAAEELLRQAVTEDPNFASAYIHLAHAINNQGRPLEEFRPHAETAFRLSETTTERERYFIRGSYYHLLGQQEKAIAAYQALLSLYPDHFWGSWNLSTLYYRQNRFKDAAELMVRLADLRPRDFLANYIAALSLAALDRTRSRLYVRRALEAVSPADMEKFPGEVGWVELVPAAEGWLDGNLAHALRVADGLAARIDSLSGRARVGFAGQVVPVYLELGRLDAAARCIQKIPDPSVRHEMLAYVAFIRDDPGALKRHLEALEEPTEPRPGAVGSRLLYRASLLARAGLLPQAARLLTRMEGCCATGYLETPRGELALARGDVDKGISEIEEGIRLRGDFSYFPFFLGSESLATALKQKGDLARAVQVLERASARRSHAAFENSGSYWLRSRFQLAQLYRETGREGDAREIEGELRKLLALADSGHPILRALARLPIS